MDEYEVGRVYNADKLPAPIRQVAGAAKYVGGDPMDPQSWSVVIPADVPTEPRESTSESSIGAFREAGPRPMDIARLLTHGATFGLSDEIAGMTNEYGDQVRDQVRRDVAGARERVGKIPSMAIEAAPTMLAPLGAVGVGVKAARPGLGILGAIGAGGAEAGAYAMGEAEGSLGERAQAAILPTAIGAGLGGLLAGGSVGISALRRSRGGRGDRLVGAFTEAAGEVAEDIAPATRRAEQWRQSVADNVYGPLEQRYQEITDPELLEFLRQGDARTATMRVSREVANGKRGPSFEELQQIRQNLVSEGKTHAPVARELSQHGHRIIPEWSAADDMYAYAVQIQDAMEEGRKHWNAVKSADAEMALEDLAGNPQAQQAFRTGQAHEILSRIGRREQSTLAPLTDFMDAGPTTERLLRTVFPTEEGWRAFQRAVNLEKSAEAVRRVVKKYAPWIIGGATLLGGGGAAGYLLGGGQ